MSETQGAGGSAGAAGGNNDRHMVARWMDEFQNVKEKVTKEISSLEEWFKGIKVQVSQLKAKARGNVWQQVAESILFGDGVAAVSEEDRHVADSIEPLELVFLHIMATLDLGAEGYDELDPNGDNPVTYLKPMSELITFCRYPSSLKSSAGTLVN